MFTFFSEQKFTKTGQFSEFLKLFLNETFWVIFKHCAFYYEIIFMLSRHEKKTKYFVTLCTLKEGL